MTSEDFKALGNKAFQGGDFIQAVDLFTKAINGDSQNHVLYSNRSAAYTSLKKYDLALQDADKTIAIKKDWAKGYSRKGAAHQGLGQFQEAIQAFEEGLKMDPNNSLLLKGLKEAEDAMSSSTMGGLGNLFGPDLLGKIAANPKCAPYLAQPDFMAKIMAIQANPSSMNQYMDDPRIMTVLMAMMGLDAKVATSAEEADQVLKEEGVESTSFTKEEPMKKASYQAPVPKVEPEVDLTPEEQEKKKRRMDSDSQKELGNNAYKKKMFKEALGHYEKAWELDSSNIAILTNKAAVLFEMENYQESIKACEEAVQLGRDQFADFKLIARALGRIGNAYMKLKDMANAIKYYEKSLSEHRTADILSKLREAEKLKKEMDIEAYRDPALSDKAREEGNACFKNHDYAEAVKHYTEAIKRNDVEGILSEINVKLEIIQIGQLVMLNS
jgi:stress-induced-phosphoprotein 1